MVGKLVLSFAFKQVVDFYTDFRFPAEYRSDFAFFHMLQADRVSILRQRYVLYLLDQAGRVFEIKFHVLSDFGPAIETLLAYVDEDRTRERLIAAIFDGFGGGQYRTFAGIDRGRFQFLLVLDVIGETEIAQGIAVVGDTLNEHVIVFAGGKVAAAGFGLADDGFGKVIKSSRISARTKELQGAIRPFGSDLVPGRHFSLSRRFPHFLQVRYG